MTELFKNYLDNEIDTLQTQSGIVFGSILDLEAFNIPQTMDAVFPFNGQVPTYELANSAIGQGYTEGSTPGTMYFICPAGLYRLQPSVRWAHNTSGRRWMSVIVGGTGYRFIIPAAELLDDVHDPGPCLAVVGLGEGVDQIALSIGQDSGGPLDALEAYLYAQRVL